MGIYSVEGLSISKIGDLLVEQLGQSAGDYVFPNDFLKAVADIDFSGVVVSGDSAPYDLVIIGNAWSKMVRWTNDNNLGVLYKSVRFVGVPSEIPDFAFRKQTALKSVVIPNGTAAIGQQAFRLCSGLESITVPDSVTTIGVSAFYGCSSLEQIICNGVTAFTDDGNVAAKFGDCLSLKVARFPKVVSAASRSGSAGTFNNCTALETVQFGSVGHPCNTVTAGNFNGCTQAGLTIEIYANNNISTIVSNIRSTATNATIVIKAATDLVYNGTNYAEGDTVVTSTP